MTWIALLVALLGGYVSESMIGEERWPLTEPHGVLACEPAGFRDAITFTAPDGTTYAVSGGALDLGYPRLDPIWWVVDRDTGERMSITPLEAAAELLCAR